MYFNLKLFSVADHRRSKYQTQPKKKLKVVSLKLKISKKKSYKVDEGSPKMRFKALNNVFDEVWVTKKHYT